MAKIRYVIQKDYVCTHSFYNWGHLTWWYGKNHNIICVTDKTPKFLESWMKKYGYSSLECALEVLKKEYKAAQYETDKGEWKVRVSLQSMFDEEI